MEAMEAEKQQLIAKDRDANLRKSLAAELTKAGVDPRFMKAAIATLIDSDKLVNYTSSEYEDNKDKIVFRAQDGEEELPRGLNNWVKSDEGKNFVAPKGAKGSGAVGIKNLNNSAPENPQKAAEENLLALIQKARGGG
jgi:hypothetical protein